MTVSTDPAPALTDGRGALELLPDDLHTLDVDEPGDNGNASDEGTQVREPQRAPVYGDVVSWVENMMLRHYRRPLTSDTKWCPYWWKHAEAVARLEACWRAWEHLRHEGPTGVAVWFRDYFDPTMAQVTSREGPFHACRNDSRGGHQTPPLWESAPAPPGLFTDMHHPAA
jgi:hypothetical protein